MLQLSFLNKKNNAGICRANVEVSFFLISHSFPEVTVVKSLVYILDPLSAYTCARTHIHMQDALVFFSINEIMVCIHLFIVSLLCSRC